MSLSRFKLVFFSPQSSTQVILSHLFSKYPRNIGKIGNYEQCAFVTPGTGQFKPTYGSDPTIGSLEDRVEVLVLDTGGNEELKGAIRELKNVHPYEEVAYDVYRLENF
ncbi:hypothetical protein BDQ17DRAFT_1387286 [Cyathus striatus]|nr:hypothetical protein BDQ17DRAFT_1387286 [Cyathus striatus]